MCVLIPSFGSNILRSFPRAPTRASVGGSMRLRGLFDLSSIFLRVNEVSRYPYKFIYGSMRFRDSFDTP